MKIRFVQALPPTVGRSLIRMGKGERGIWQRRFWEHAIRDELDYAGHLDYVHFNPVKHGYVSVVDDSEAMEGFTDDEDVLFGGKTLELEDLVEGYPEEEKKKK